MQSLRIGVAGEIQRKVLVEGWLRDSGNVCLKRKLIRGDILESLGRIHDRVGDEKLKATALALIELEKDLKQRKKYSTLWQEPVNAERQPATLN